MILNFIVTDYPNIRIIWIALLKHIFYRRITRLFWTIPNMSSLVRAITVVVISVLDVLNL